MSMRVEIEGLEKVVAELRRRKLDVRAGVERIAHAGGTVVRGAIAELAPESIADEIVQETTGRRASAVEVSVGPSVAAFIAKFLEFGTRPHKIPKRRSRKRRKVLRFEGRFAAWANHPGARKRPFVRPGFEKSKGGAQAAMGRETKKVVRA